MSNSGGPIPVNSAYTISSDLLRRLIDEKRRREGLSWYALTTRLGLSKGALSHFHNRTRSGLSLDVFVSVAMWLADNDLPRCLGLMQDLVIKRKV